MTKYGAIDNSVGGNAVQGLHNIELLLMRELKQHISRSLLQRPSNCLDGENLVFDQATFPQC